MSAPPQTPSRITSLTAPASNASAPDTTKSSGSAKCPPGQIKDSSGNCTSVQDFVKNVTNPQAPKTPAVLASAPAPTVQAPAAPPSPRTPVKLPKFNNHVQQTAQGGANPPTLTPAPVTPGHGASSTTGPPPATPTIPPAAIPPPTPQAPMPLPPTAVPPRQAPPIPPIGHPDRPPIVPERERPPGEFQRRFPVCSFQRFPDRFRDFDHRFDDDRRRRNCEDFREEFDDDDDRRFRPFISTFFGRLNVTLVEHILGLIYDQGSASLGRDIPTGGGIWVLGVDGQWYRVNRAELNLINQIESTRMIDRHDPIIIGGGIGLQSGNAPAPTVAGIDVRWVVVAAGLVGLFLLVKKK